MSDLSTCSTCWSQYQAYTYFFLNEFEWDLVLLVIHRAELNLVLYFVLIFFSKHSLYKLYKRIYCFSFTNIFCKVNGTSKNVINKGSNYRGRQLNSQHQAKNHGFVRSA